MQTNSFISNSIIKTLVYANVFIAICAFAQVELTYHLFSISANFANNSYLLFIFLFGCSLKAQNRIEDPKEKEYMALMSKFNSTLEVSAEVQDKASSKQAN